MSKGMEYNIHETFEFFQKETERIKNDLAMKVTEQGLDPVRAREKYDMYRSMLTYLRVCVKMAEAEDYLQDNSFSALHIYAKNEERSSGDKKLAEAVRNL